MNDFVHEDIELKRQAWALHFSESRTKNKFKFAKRGNKKYVTTWVKQKDQTGLFERWVKKTQLNEKYKPEDEQIEEHSDKAKLESITPQTNWTRRSTRINLHSILDKETCRRCYVDPPSDFSVEEDEREEAEQEKEKKEKKHAKER
ncbi:conserved Plasmodium protein, unknown function [Plasmodium knowlesi strain H]|uniref:Uncharacterized protein n=3 Tax=Plasmodium knowlesi TaxID=5850 RepID=A0A5K1VGG8_PLAKH|nr:conserved Plasmodium protein, unknown function [Plasmodium knowlesi strain H]OTN68257.1 Uncharacterized protein PKNOH_S03331800 [Plasmodium knowlesi]CAA9987220.1 conserved Plasmodium protein, unknown function [Plasmodium knowlesi strain H]SBO23987.1 conserved Plasmodium protein, unknown function [Plasmodium knowlesi strain H]SBO25963.1 conserved Plasmodium protein, unknown function [Plasmodium knowlesi strain H]VVS76694.1 conserved Plasmodium protein, unknown function [Plasmodium knowlesi s|eukprot:XP_002261841.1 hypothetical protein, conserved in Plasmodium species [Plasmodium knowlesi strain H]